jgi:hypothetical protein
MFKAEKLELERLQYQIDCLSYEHRQILKELLNGLQDCEGSYFERKIDVGDPLIAAVSAVVNGGQK